MDLENYLKRHTNFRKQYKLFGEIGKGAFGKVYLAENKDKTEKYAVKVIGTKGSEELRGAQREIRIFKDLEHPNIVHYMDDFKVPNGVVVVMEYCKNGDLQQRINSRSSQPPTLDFFPETQVVEWATQACQALQYLHSKYILHRDLKPANMLLTNNDVIKLADFGTSRILANEEDVATTQCGTLLYLSPEIVQMKPYSHKADVWAAGCCFYEMMTLNPAIDPIPVRLSRQWNVRPMPLCFRKELCEIIKSMLCIDVSQRPSIGDILQKLLSIQPTGEDSPAIDSRCARIFSTEQFHPAANGPCKATLLPPTPCEAAPLPPTSCQDTPLAQTSCKATILPPTSARRRISEPVTPGRRLPEAEVNRSNRTLDDRRTVGLHPGLEVSKDAASIDPPKSQKPRSTTWYSDVEKEDSPHHRIWTISNSSILDNMAALGVRFNDKGELVELSGGRFQFNSFSDDQTTNQMRYEEIGQQVTQYVYGLLETKLNMKRCLLPIDASDEPRSFVFVTDDYTTNDKKLLVLVHGPGVPRAGQWARRVIMNDSLAAGTQLPWIQRAIEEGYAVIVLNPNLNEHEVTGTPIRENKDGIEHALYVWDKVISKEVKAKKITFAAHSAGAKIVLQLAVEREKDFADRVVGIALADSFLDFGSNTRPSVISLFAKRARIWASSDKPLDTTLTSHRNNIPKRSAGETRHEWTAGSCIPSAIKFLNERYKKN